MGLVVIVSDWDYVWDTGLVLLVHVVPCYLRNMRRCQCCVKAWRGYRCPSVPGTLSNCSVWQCTLLGVCGDLNCEGMWKLLQFYRLTQCRKPLPKKPCPQTTSPAWSLLAAPPPLQWANTAEDVSPLEEVKLLQNNQIYKCWWNTEQGLKEVMGPKSVVLLAWWIWWVDSLWTWGHNCLLHWRWNFSLNLILTERFPGARFKRTFLLTISFCSRWIGKSWSRNVLV